MLTEVYEVWSDYNKYNIPTGRYYLKNIRDDFEDLKITLHNEDNSIEIIITFSSIIETYRSTPEGNLLSTLQHLHTDIGDFPGKHEFIYVVKHSNLINWLKNERMFEHDDYYDSAIHYCVITSDYITDIVTHGDPTINIRKLPIS
jgi:hypothetical protein